LDADWGDLVPVVAGSARLGERRNKTGSGLLTSVALLRGTIERQPLAPLQGVIQNAHGLRRKKSMGNIPGLSVTVGWTEDVAGVIEGIAWEMFNSTDKDMEVNINAVPVQGTPPLPIDTDLPEGVTVSPNWNTIGFLVVPRGVYNVTVQLVNGPTYLVATDVLVPIGRHRILRDTPAPS
jgi:hypothetical protein